MVTRDQNTTPDPPKDTIVNDTVLRAAGALATLAGQVNASHDRATEAAQTTIEHARKCGELLTQAKSIIGHGEFQAWLLANCRVKVRQAQKYMTLHRAWGTIAAISASDARLSIDGALQLLDGAATYGQRLEVWAKRAEDYERRIEEALENVPELTEDDLSDTVPGFPHFRKLRDWMTELKGLCGKKAIHNLAGLKLRDECPAESEWMMQWATDDPAGFGAFLNSLKWLCEDDNEFAARRAKLIDECGVTL